MEGGCSHGHRSRAAPSGMLVREVAGICFRVGQLVKIFNLFPKWEFRDSEQNQ
jgi:hypothetical protein